MAWENTKFKHQKSYACLSLEQQIRKAMDNGKLVFLMSGSVNIDLSIYDASPVDCGYQFYSKYYDGWIELDTFGEVKLEDIEECLLVYVR